MTSTVPKKPERPIPQVTRSSFYGRLLWRMFGGIGLLVVGFILYQVFAPALFIFLVFGVIGTFHYLTWGWWLGPYLRSISTDGSQEDELAK